MFSRTSPAFAHIAHRPAVVMVCGLILMALVALAGCSTTPSPVNPGGPILGSSTATATLPAGGRMAVRPCPGPVGSLADAGQPATVLTQSTTSASAHVGDLVQVRLPATQHWGYQSEQGILSLVDPGGVQDVQQNICFWNFRAQSPGTMTLHFSGTAMCDNLPCPQYVLPVVFTVTIS